MVYRYTLIGNVVKGPSPMELSTAVMNAFPSKDSPNPPFLVSFKFGTGSNGIADALKSSLPDDLKMIWDNETVEAKIVSLGNESGTGHDFNIKGMFRKPKSDFWTSFEGYYSTQKRTGYLKWEAEFADDK